MTNHYDALVTHLRDVAHLHSALGLLNWDQETQMPPGAAQARAGQLATLSRMSHEIFTSDKTQTLLNAAETEVDMADYDSDAASMLRVVRKDLADATRLPAEFVSEMTRERALAHDFWVKARQDNNFAHFLPALERIMALTQRMAEYLGYSDHPYDALLNQYEQGMTTAEVERIFEEHRPALVDLIAQIGKKPQVNDKVLHQAFPIEKQRDFALDIVKAFGFDFNRGVQAISVHPFATNFSINDVRITTRFSPNFLNPAIFGMMHEAGHGMYEQGGAQHLDATPLAGGTSLGVHESQSRLWENVVGRSKGFWSWALPRLQASFPDQVGNISVDDFYRAINKVQQSFIRVEADEATYNLHIILRFELEKDILTGKIALKDLPKEWNQRFEAYFGKVPPNDSEGVLQDVHWSAGLVGYFPTYALGNLLSLQYYNCALKEHPSLPDEIAAGKFDTLHSWLQTNIHQHGRKFTSSELTQRITGEAIQSRDYIAYLQQKFGDIYGL